MNMEKHDTVKEYIEEKDLIDKYGKVFSTSEGKEILLDILSMTNFMAPSEPNSNMLYEQGQKLVASYIVGKIVLSGSKAFDEVVSSMSAQRRKAYVDAYNEKIRSVDTDTDYSVQLNKKLGGKENG